MQEKNPKSLALYLFNQLDSFFTLPTSRYRTILAQALPNEEGGTAKP